MLLFTGLQDVLHQIMGPSELDRGNEAEETGQVRKTHGSRDQQGNRADEGARPPVLELGPGRSTPEREPRVTDHRVLVGNGVVLLSDGEDVQGENAARGNLELVFVREPSKQHRSGEGVRAHEQRRRRPTRCHHSRPTQRRKQELEASLAPHGPFREPACAPPSLVATAQPHQPDEPAGRQTHWGQQPRRGAWTRWERGKRQRRGPRPSCANLPSTPFPTNHRRSRAADRCLRSRRARVPLHCRRSRHARAPSRVSPIQGQSAGVLQKVLKKKTRRTHLPAWLLANKSALPVLVRPRLRMRGATTVQHHLSTNAKKKINALKLLSLKRSSKGGPCPPFDLLNNTEKQRGKQTKMKETLIRTGHKMFKNCTQPAGQASLGKEEPRHQNTSPSLAL